MKNILIAGGSGLIGSRLTEMLLEKGYSVNILSRKKISENNIITYLWNPAGDFIEEAAIQNADHIINLAGEGIADKRWSVKRKKEIMHSRVNASKTIFNALQKNIHHVKSIVCASAMGYYSKNTNELLTEESETGSDFLASTVQHWEAANREFEKTKLRTVIFRLGLVSSLKGGALAEMHKPLKFGIAAYFGNGNQYYSWIHIDDLCTMIMHAIENENTKGIYNAVSPHPEKNKNFMKIFAQAKGGFHLRMPVPRFVIKTMLGERASIVLDGQKVSSQKIEDTGFVFKYPDLRNALSNLIISSGQL
ncbi:MAG TPA: TIGR01777 family oxidoreductase [Bacteroidia bacterium]|nr:TIGR01777 family oxidoreductase [Bacteroidia bacterium]